MERLIEARLLHGGLMEIREPHLIGRYNAALEAFGLAPTARDGFSIDATGYSPEIAADLSDENYLDPHAVNRRVIILKPEQRDLPIVHVHFSSIIEHMAAFFHQNARALHVLTLKDVVFGEIEDGTYRVDGIEDVLAIREVEFRLRTADGLISAARELEDMITRFREQPDSWRNQALITAMIDGARKCGDIRRHDVIPRHTHFAQGSFWTKHLGGIYVFRELDDDDDDDDDDDAEGPTVLGWVKRPKFARETKAIDRYIALSSVGSVHRFLSSMKSIETLSNGWLIDTGSLEKRIDYLVRAAIARSDPAVDLVAMRRADINNWIHANFDALTDDGLFPALTELRRAVTSRERIAMSKVPGALKFMLLRARPSHPDREVVNRLISEFVPFDFVTRYAVNREAFYRDYEAWPENMKHFAIHTLTADGNQEARTTRHQLYEEVKPWG
jgi:hypothetical protein